MFIDRLLNQTNAPLLERTIQFTAQRQQLLAEDVAGKVTPGHVDRDLDIDAFQKMLQDRVEQRDKSAPGSVDFDDLKTEPGTPTRNILFHDRTNGSMEQLMSDSAKNALLHNMLIELMRKQFAQMDMALREKLG